MSTRLTQILGGLLQSDLALRLVQNEALMKAMLKTFSVSVEVRQMMESQLQGLMKGLDLARRDDIDGLRREIGALRNVVADLEGRLEDALDRIDVLSAGEGDDFLPRAGLDQASPYAAAGMFGSQAAFDDDASPYAELYDDEASEAPRAEAPPAPSKGKAEKADKPKSSRAKADGVKAEGAKHPGKKAASKKAADAAEE